MEALFEGLTLAGVAMAVAKSSRPASGAEHHISHMIEMEPEAVEVKFSALHGEKTGVGTVIASEEYYRLREIEDIAPYVKDYAAVSDEKLSGFFGEKLADAVINENKNDSLAPVSRERLVECWSEIRDVISGIPTAKELYAILEKLDARRSLESIGVSEDSKAVLLEYSPLVRNRLTLMRIRRMIKI